MSKDCCEAEKIDLTREQNVALKKVFWIVLFINLVMFFTEAIGGYLAHSNALWADSLDMLADVFVYGVSLYVLTKGHQARVKASLLKGYLMFALGLFVIGEAIYKIIYPIQPTSETISIIGGVALIANVSCLLLLLRHKNTDLNVRSAWICSRNDVLSNVGVIFAGIFVGYLNSMWPDILVGLGIALLVLQSSFKIIKEGMKHKQEVVF